MQISWEARTPWQIAIIQRLSRDETIGLVFPTTRTYSVGERILPYALALAERLGISELLPKTTFNFPVGSMFWARTAALRPLFELGFELGRLSRRTSAL